MLQVFSIIWLLSVGQSLTTLLNSSSVIAREVYTWKQRDFYYFDTLEKKMSIVLLEQCQKSYRRVNDSTTLLPDNDFDLYVSSFPISENIINWWKGFKKPTQMRVDPYICTIVYQKRLPIFNNTGCQLPTYMSPFAPRCQTQYLRWACEQSSIPISIETPNYFVLPESDHQTTDLPPQPWLLTARNAFVTMCGQISLPCGMVHTNANCKATGYIKEAKMFRSKCPLSFLADNARTVSEQQSKEDNSTMTTTTCLKGAPFDQVIHHYERVFVVAEVDDTYVYHIHLEIMPRIVYHLKFLIDNPDVKILIGCDAKNSKSATRIGLRQGLQAIAPMMALVNLSMDRLIVHQHIYAKEIYFPMEGGCQDPVYNTWQILYMRQMFMKSLSLSDKRPPSSNKPVMMLLKRSSSSKHTRNGFDLVRQWGDNFTAQIMAALRHAFPQYEVRLYSDRNDTLMRCYACQIEAFASTDVLIGVHGAGLGNMLYMRPTSAVVEIAPYGNDGRCLLGGGPFSRLAAVMAHNYMMHMPPYEEFQWLVKDATSTFNISRFILHVHSYLKSISALTM